MLTEDRLDEIHTELNRQLAAAGIALDGIYYCPIAPQGVDRTTVECPDRKPGPGMLLRSAADLRLNLAASWMVGDMISDVLAGFNAGCRSILIKSGQALSEEVESFSGQALVVSDLAAAADSILSDQGTRR